MSIIIWHVKIGGLIKKAREAKGLTQPELSDLCGWGYVQARISHYEKNRRKPSLDNLQIIAKALGLKLFELLDEKQTKGTSVAPSSEVNELADMLLALNPTRQRLFRQLLQELQ